MLMVVAFNWFNPVIWYSFYRMQEDCELACDEKVLKYLGPNCYNNYGSTIIDMAKLSTNSHSLFNGAALASNKSNLKRRISMISSFKGKSFKWSLIGLSLIILIAIVCLVNPEVAVNSYGKTLLKPKKVIEQFFEYYNQKNLEGMNSLNTERRHSSETNWGFDNLEYIKVINIVEDNNQAEKEIHIRNVIHGKEKNHIIDPDKEKLELENVIIFKVDFVVKYKTEGIGPEDSGRDTYEYILIRKDKNSPWLIDGFGH